MTTIREYLTSRLAAAEELAQYREFKVDVSIVSIEATGNSVTPTRVTMKMIQKFILYNGQERIILEKYETILAPNSLGFRIPAFQNET